MVTLDDWHGKSYFNTVGEDGMTLLEYMKKANKQDREVLAFFRKHPSQSFTPPEVKRLSGSDALLSSIRRTMTVLAGKRYLTKTDIRRPGNHGRDNCCWKLRHT